MTENVRWFSRDPARELPAVTSLPPALWKDAELALCPTMRALWVALPSRVARVGLPGPWMVVQCAQGAVAWSAGVDVLVRGDAISVNRNPRLRRGMDLSIQREPGGAWTVEGVPLPEGARWSAACRPTPEGRGLVWADAGFVYRWDLVGSPRVLGRGSAIHVDRHGRLAIGPPEIPKPLPAPEVPEDATLGRCRVAGLSMVAKRAEGRFIRGWARDGTVLVDQLELRSNS